MITISIIFIFQQVLHFIQHTVNPIGFEVDEVGKSDVGHHFGDEYETSPEYIIDDDYTDLKLF